MSVLGEVLSYLEENTDKFISGEKIAKKLNVSRTAVWKAVRTLKADGYTISSVRNRGYKLILNSSVLSAKLIRARLKSDVELIVLEQIDSTNNEAKRRLTSMSQRPLLIVAKHQSAGRGRLGRSFYSPMNTGLYMSLMLRPTFSFSDAVSVTSAAAVAVCRALGNFTDKKPQIKWVNDIYVQNKKVCGILTEAISDFEMMSLDCVIIGIGVNIDTESFPDDIKKTAGAIGAVDKNRLCAEIADNLISLVCNINDRTFIEEYKAHSLVLGKDIVYIENGKSFKAKAVDINENGELIIIENGERKKLSSGEISVRLNDSAL